MDLWLLEWSFTQRTFHLRPALGQAATWWPGHDWLPLAIGSAPALEALAVELEDAWR